MEQSVRIIKTNTEDPQYKEQIYNLREQVLRIPLNLSLKNEDLSKDILDTVLVAMQDEEAIGCVMLHPLQDGNFKLRQMAVKENWQGKSVGRQLVQAAEYFAREQGSKKIVLHARYHAVPFYDKLGYSRMGGMFTEVGIPHIKMEKEL